MEHLLNNYINTGMGMERFCTTDVTEGFNYFLLMITCLNDLVNENYNDKGELVERFVNYGIEASEAFERFLKTIADAKQANDVDILEAIDSIDAMNSELQRTLQKVEICLQRCEMLEEDKTNQRAECIKTLETIVNYKNDAEKAKKNEVDARRKRNVLLVVSALSACTGFGLIVAGPLLYGALVPGQTSIDQCAKAKKEALNRLNKKCDELKVNMAKVAVTNKVKETCYTQIEKLSIEINDNVEAINQFRLYRNQLNTLNSEIFWCLHLIKILNERHSLLLYEFPLAMYSNHCILFSVHWVLDILKTMQLPFNVGQIQLPAMPEVLIPSAITIGMSNELNFDDLAPLHQEQMLELLHAMPCAMYGLHRLSLYPATAKDIHGFNHDCAKGIQMLCNTFLEVHSSMDFLHGIVKNMQMMLAEAGRQILGQMDEDEFSKEGLIKQFELFNVCMNFLQVTATVASDKVAFNEINMQECLEYWSRRCQQLIQSEYECNQSLDHIETDRGNIAIHNEFSLQRQEYLIERKQKIIENTLEMENKFHSAIADVRLDKRLLAVDVGIELALDVVFCLVPFMKAAEFAEEALVVGHYLIKQVLRYAPAVKNTFLACFGKKQNGKEDEDNVEEKHRIYKYSDMILKYADEFQQFISEDGRLINVIFVELPVLKCELITFLGMMSGLPECHELGQLMAICLCGIAVCESLEVVESKNIDPTTSEADQVVGDIQNFIKTAEEFVAEAEQFKNGTTSVHKRSDSRWYHLFLNGFTGYQAKHKLFLAQTASDRIHNEENRLKPINRSLNKEVIHTRSRKLEDTILQLKQSREESRLISLLELQTLMSNLKMIWEKICTNFTHIEVILKCANDKMSGIHIMSSSSIWNRFVAYQQAFEAVKMFEDLSKFTNAYLAVSEKHFMPMLNSLIRSIECEGADSKTIDFQRIEFEEKMENCIFEMQVLLAIESTKLEDC